MDANRERCVKAGTVMYGVLARYTNSEVWTIVKSVSEDGQSESMCEVTCELQQKNVGRMFRVQRDVNVSEACEGCRPSAIGDHAMGGEVEGDVV